MCQICPGRLCLFALAIGVRDERWFWYQKGDYLFEKEPDSQNIPMDIEYLAWPDPVIGLAL